jgi:tetratricopeptide (TPR) repeat protein
LGVWFFLILVPTSSVLPIRDAVAEHRLYLSLAALSALVILGGYRLVARLAPDSLPRALHGFSASILILAVALGLRTRARNTDYRDEARLWEQALRVGQELGLPNELAHYNIGVIRSEQGRHEEALALFREVLEIQPGYIRAYNNVGSELHSLGHHREAVPYYLTAMRLEPEGVARGNLELAFSALGQGPEEAERYSAVIASGKVDTGLDPDWMATVHVNVGSILLQKARSSTSPGQQATVLGAARTELRRALKYDPQHALARQRGAEVEDLAAGLAPDPARELGR